MQRMVRHLCIGLAFCCAGLHSSAAPEAPDLQRQEGFEAVEQWLVRQVEADIDAQEEPDEEAATQCYLEALDLAKTLYDHPVDLNRTDMAGLEQMVWLTPLQIKSLLHYREEHGRIASVYEIPYILGFDEETTRWLQYFVTTADSGTGSAMRSKRGKGEVIATARRQLQPIRGFLLPDSVANRYLGDPYALTLRAGYTWNSRWQLHLGADKDAGEPFFTGGHHGADSYSGSLAYQGEGTVQKIVLGHFKVDWGQGLIAGNAFSTGISNLSTAAKRQASGLRPYTSTGESGFLNGIGCTLEQGHWTWSGWYARTALDARLVRQDTLGGDGYFTSFATGGYHRTASEEATRRQVRENVAGTHLQWRIPDCVIGVTWMQYRFDHPFLPEAQPYRLFANRGTGGYNVGADFRFTWHGILGFGEAACSGNGAWALTAGMQWLWPGNASVYMIYRRYDRDYHTRYGTSAGASSSVANENGWHLGFNLPGPGRWTWSGYADIARAPWLKYGTDAPSSARRYALRMQYAPSRRSSLSLQWLWRTRDANRTGSPVDQRITSVRQQELRCRFQCAPSARLTLQTQLAGKHYRKETAASDGFLLAQNATLLLWQERLQCYAQAAYFRTDDYQSSVWLAEKDLLYGFSSGMYYRCGWHAAFMLRYTVEKQWSLRCKYAWTWYRQPGTGSGLNASDGHVRDEIRCQVIRKF